MHVQLTDVITCPRCGPEFGLILLAERVENRRVFEGWLGCANCRERYRVEHGFADLRFDAGEVPTVPARVQSQEDALQIAALLGVTEGPALVLIAGSAAVNASAVAALVPGLEVLAAWAPLVADPERTGVSRLAAGETLPLRSASMRGVVVTDAAGAATLAEAVRVAAPRARVVVFNGSADVVRHLEQSGLRVIMADARATVAVRPAF